MARNSIGGSFKGSFKGSFRGHQLNNFFAALLLGLVAQGTPAFAHAPSPTDASYLCKDDTTYPGFSSYSTIRVSRSGEKIAFNVYPAVGEDDVYDKGAPATSDDLRLFPGAPNPGYVKFGTSGPGDDYNMVLVGKPLIDLEESGPLLWAFKVLDPSHPEVLPTRHSYNCRRQADE